jgi:hypothetical protein
MDSFQDAIYIMPGQALAYPGGTATPHGPTYLKVTTESLPLDPETRATVLAAVEAWFRQSIIPLVGPDLAASLPLSGEFIEAVLAYREGFVEETPPEGTSAS